MGQTIISAIGVYISTSIDYLIILFILFALTFLYISEKNLYLSSLPTSSTVFPTSLAISLTGILLIKISKLFFLAYSKEKFSSESASSPLHPPLATICCSVN